VRAAEPRAICCFLGALTPRLHMRMAAIDVLQQPLAKVLFDLGKNFFPKAEKWSKKRRLENNAMGISSSMRS
jgi:hypothetical protein